MKENNLIYKNFYLCLIIVYTIFIFIACLIPLPTFNQEVIPSFFLFKYLDKVFHFLSYVLWTFLYILLFKKKYWGLILASMIGFIIEILQSFTGYRDFQTTDILANVFGSLNGILIYIKFPNTLSKLDQYLKVKFRKSL